MLTSEERARRRTRKVNKRIERELPLFAGTAAIDPFLTTEDEQLERVKRWDAFNEDYFKDIKESDRRDIVLANELRLQFAQVASEDELRVHDERLAILKEHYLAFTNEPIYVVDFWRCLLRDKATNGKTA